MKHHTSSEFSARYGAPPANVQALADKNFSLLKDNPDHPSLHFRRIGRFFSVRIGLRYRALGVDASDGVLWFWIGSHADYDKLLS